MRPIFDLKIHKNNKEMIHVNNINNPLDFSIKASRHLDYSDPYNEVIFANFLDPFLTSDVLLKRSLDKQQTITIQAGFQRGYHTYLYPFATGQVLYYKGSYENENDYLQISYSETSIDSQKSIDFLSNSYIKEPIKNTTWLNAVSQIFKHVDPESLQRLDSKTIINVPCSDYYTFLQNLVVANSIHWFFFNNVLYFSSITNSKKYFDLTNPYSIKTPCSLIESNPYIILKELNPLECFNRTWVVETVFNPNMIVGDTVIAVDKYYNKKKGIIIKIEYNINNDLASNLISFVEVVKK